MEYFVLFLFGVIIGSFLNVFILRYNTGNTLLGRSMCLSCMNQLKWHELIPVLSFISQKGKCKKCKSKISYQYPIVELISGFLTVLSFMLSNNFADFVLISLFFYVLLIISVYDVHHYIIPDSWIVTLFVISVLHSFVLFLNNDISINDILYNILVGSIFLIVIFLLSKKNMMGFADGKLLFAISLMFGYVAAISGLFLGSVIGSIVIMIAYIVDKFIYKIGKNITIKTQVPFAPFIVAGALFGIVFDISYIWLNIIY